MNRRALPLVLSAVALSACFDNVDTDFPDAGTDRDAGPDVEWHGLEPWEAPNEAPAPEGTDEDPYPEEITFVRKRWMGNNNSIHSRAYVHADLETTFAAVRHPLAGADRRPAVTFTWEDDVEPDYPFSHRSHLVIPDIVTVEFELTWRSDYVQRDPETDAPTMAATRWQKTWGTTAISLLEGSIVCRRVSDDVTELQIQYHLNAVGSGFETIEDYLTGYYDSILLLAHGTAPEDLPPQ